MKWFTGGRKVRAWDSMQKYTYSLKYKAGTKIRQYGFMPKYTPYRMLIMGVFEGKYLNDCEGEFPIEWFNSSKNSRSKVADPSLNYFKVKSRLSLQEWRDRGWIPVHKNDKDVRGWFQWYCRYWLGRRMLEVDKIQIKRWLSFSRHYAQVVKNARGDMSKRRKQRQALLQWSWDCKV
jgi:hypothetical protein